MDATNLIPHGQPGKSLDARSGIAAISGVMAISTLLLALLFFYLSIQSTTWQFVVLACVFTQTGIISLIGLINAPKGKFGLKGLGYLSGSFALTLIVTASLLEGISLPLSLIYLVYSLILTATISNMTRRASSIILGLITSTLIILAGTFFQATQIPTPQEKIIIPVVLSIVIMVYITLLAIQFVSSPLQVRLTTSFLAIVIVPLAISSVIQSQISANRLRSETFLSLKSAADEVAIVLDNFLSNNMGIISAEADNPAFSQFLSIPNFDPDKAVPEKSMQAALKLLETRESSERKFLSSYALLDKNGKNVYDTLDKNIGSIEINNDYFKVPMETGKPYYSPVLFDENGNAFIYFSAPVKDKSRKEVIGVLRSRYNALVLQRLATAYSRLITFNSHAIIYDENLIRLADDYEPILVFTPVMDLLPEKIQELITTGRMPLLTGRTYPSNPEFAHTLAMSQRGDTAYTEMSPNTVGSREMLEMIAFSTTHLQPWKVAYIKANVDQKQAEQQQAQSSILIASIMSLIVGLIAIGASQILAKPIIDLTQTAREVSAGNLEARAQYSGNDEYGTLGMAFNSMTDRIRLSIKELEDRVTQRTIELERRNETLTYRSTQLQTVAEVARSIATSQELENLLASITELVSDRFGFYHVGVFLLDEKKENAFLRAANSEGGKRMLNRKHSLKVGKLGIVGYVTGTGEPRIATNVGEDAVFFNNPDLPLTRSEMALPLRIGDQITGALDVQSTVSNAFTVEDVALFSTLADQVAIAIYNNQLYADTARALADAQALHQQYLRQEWQAEISTHRNHAYRYSPQGLDASEPAQLSMDQDETYQTGEPISASETMPDGTTRVIMEVPIHLRGETIGAIRIQDQSEDRYWTENEIHTVRDVAQQIGVALESARLFESTMRRAERERKVLDITGRIRATNDPQEMLAIAAAELHQALGATRAQIIFRKNGAIALPHSPDNNSENQG
jgi:GAF domain-containing protein/HAMP domain-containing protein